MSTRAFQVSSAAPGAPSLGWLQQLLHERVSAALELRAEAGRYIIQSRGEPHRAIDMPEWEWQMGEGVSKHAWYDSAKEGWSAVDSGPLPAPGVSVLNAPVIASNGSGYSIEYDILGLARWALSRAEEVGRKDLDEHGRFPATSSHAFRNGYLDTPVVDEWFAILRQVAKRVWPALPLVQLEFSMRVSHDVDRPSAYAFCTLLQLLRNIGGDLVKRRDFAAAVRRPQAWLTGSRLHPADPFNTFDWLMSLSERHGLVSAFYFVCGRTEGLRDPTYEVEHPAIRRLIRDIHARGHEVGLHPSYGACERQSAISREATRLRKVCTEEGVSQSRWGGRMHYLRWKSPHTMYEWQRAGMDYDSTLGYADRAGFRCGTCIDYTAFDPVEAKPLQLRLRPLIAMEGSVLHSVYMGLGATPAAYEVFSTLKRTCRAVGGSFNLLWHNSQLVSREERELYRAVLEA